jgi:spore maturation protein CgeB
MKFVLLGLSITSSWGNGHATNYRALVRALSARGHDVLFLERDMPWYAAQRDLPRPPWGTTRLYDSLDELRAEYTEAVRAADLVVVGSYVPEGVAVGEWVVQTTRGVPAFYDIDTPVTLAKLARGDHEYLTPELVRAYRLYLSFTGGPTLARIEDELGSPCARALHCLVDPDAYPVLHAEPRWDLGYLGTYSPDRQPALARLLLEPARRNPALRCVVAGPDYPDDSVWPASVERIEHLAPVISDVWPGLETFFTPDQEILLPADATAVLQTLASMDERERRAIGRRARERVLAQHTANHRAAELEGHVLDVRAAA